MIEWRCINQGSAMGEALDRDPVIELATLGADTSQSPARGNELGNEGCAV